MTLTIKQLVSGSFENSKSKGWWNDPKTEDPINPNAVIPEKLCLIHSEVSEALEDFRDGKMNNAYVTKEGNATLNPSVVVGSSGNGTLRTELHKPVGFASEMADIVIRVADLCGAMGIDLERAIEEKMAFNKTRASRHGGKAC